MDGESNRHGNQESILHDRSLKPHTMSLQYLAKITNNFSDERILGKGGFGVVYLGVLEDGEKVAVKKLGQSITVQEKQFENEVDLLMRLKHPNIVRLLGYCYETQKLYIDHEGKFIFAENIQTLLCLEYLPKKSLDTYLSEKSPELRNWHTCYKIIEGICHGLHYLHEEIAKPIIHLDIKPANILLDDNNVPKITDFGLSRLLHQQQTIYTNFANGTRGYMPPEYIKGGVITPMSDIFSLGVVIIEVITGHRGYPDVVATSEAFVELELERWRSILEKAPEASLEMDCEQIKRCIQIGLFCVNPKRIKRPTTKRIINMLDGLESTVSFSEWLESIDCHVSNEATSTRAQALNAIVAPPATISVDHMEYVLPEPTSKLDEHTPTSTKKDYGRGEREAQWATAQRTIHGLQAPEPSSNTLLNDKSSYRELSEMAEQAKRRAEMARLRELITLKGHVESVEKLKGIDIDSINQNYTV